MRILCVSDQIDPLVYSSQVKERYKDVDAVFAAGDLSLEYVDYIVTTMGKPTYFVFGNHNLKEFKFYKKGTHTENFYENPITQIQNHGHGADYAGNKVIRCRHLGFKTPAGKTTPLLIAGVSGSLKYNNGLAQYTEFQMFRQLLEMVPALLWNKIRYGRYCDIFLTHASPRHIHDREDQCHKGFECYNWFIKKFKPALMIHGHIQLYDLQAKRVTKTGETTVVNAYSHLVLDLSMDFDSKGEKIGSDVSIHPDR